MIDKELLCENLTWACQYFFNSILTGQNILLSSYLGCVIILSALHQNDVQRKYNVRPEQTTFIQSERKCIQGSTETWSETSIHIGSTQYYGHRDKLSCTFGSISITINKLTKDPWIVQTNTYFFDWPASERSKNSIATRPSTELRAYPAD